MKYYIIAGEASGDLHGSNLIKEIQKLDRDSSIRCWGGDHMRDAGGELVKHYRDLAFMGFVEVIRNLRTILRNLRFCKTDILQFRPVALILIDYPGFNIRIAQWAKEQGLKVIYYVSPQVWAWQESRVKILKKCVDRMLVILPFEKDFYKKWNYEVEYVGHPLVQVVEEFLSSRQSAPIAIGGNQQSTVDHNTKPNTNADKYQNSKPIVALLPGSRKQEIAKKLPVMLGTSKYFPGCEFIVGKAPAIEESFYENYIQGYPNVRGVRSMTYELLMIADAALVTSGTATLETALFAVPEVVCYKGSTISYQIARRVIKVPFISLVNLIMNREVVKELIQDDLTESNLHKELDQLLNNTARRTQLAKDYQELKNILSEGGHASSNAAKIIIDFLGKS